MEIIKEIEKILVWYKENYKSQDIVNFLNAQDKLAILSYNLAQESGEAKMNYNMSYFIRKINVSKSIQGLMAGRQLSKAQAENESIVSCEKFFNQESISEATTYQYDLLLRQVNRILDAMRTRISYLKSEKELTKYQNQT